MACRRSLSRLESEVVRVALVPRVAIFATLTDPASWADALETWETASTLLEEARRNAVAACDGM
jgi:hypothetical protein